MMISTEGTMRARPAAAENTEVWMQVASIQNRAAMGMQVTQRRKANRITYSR